MDGTANLLRECSDSLKTVMIFVLSVIVGLKISESDFQLQIQRIFVLMKFYRPLSFQFGQV